MSTERGVVWDAIVGQGSPPSALLHGVFGGSLVSSNSSQEVLARELARANLGPGDLGPGYRVERERVTTNEEVLANPAYPFLNRDFLEKQVQRLLGHRVTLVNDNEPSDSGDYEEVTIFIICCASEPGALAYHSRLAEYLRSQAGAVPISPGPIGFRPRGYRLNPDPDYAEYHLLTATGRFAVELVAVGSAGVVTVQRAARLLGTVITNLHTLDLRVSEAPSQQIRGVGEA